MKTLLLALLLGPLLAPLSALAEEPAPKPCFDPANPCPGFKEHDLSFPLPADGVARPQAQSTQFYAVILLSAERCTITENRRKEVQNLFPRQKVFSMRFQCGDNVENNVTYTNVNDKLGFLAVYAGLDKAQADAFLAQVRAMGRFAGANLRRTQVLYLYP